MDNSVIQPQQPLQQLFATPEYVTVDEMASMLSIARATAYQLTKRKDFPCFYVGKRIIIPLTSFREWTGKLAAEKAEI